MPRDCVLILIIENLASDEPSDTFEICRLLVPYPVSFPNPSPGRSVTRARGLYVSRKANFRVSDPRYGAVHTDVRSHQLSKGPLPMSPSLARNFALTKVNLL